MDKQVIVPISMLPFGMLNAYLIIRKQRAILIDTGLPNSANRIEKVLKKAGMEWLHIDLIILTHGHIDHVGSAHHARVLSSAPIVAHAGDVPYIQDGKRPMLNPTGTFGKFFIKTRAIEQPFKYFQPDITMIDNELSLEDFGFRGRILHTPGHTPGSLSVFLDDGEVVAGDLVASGILLGGIMLKDRPKPPPFEEDRQAVLTSLKFLLNEGAKKFYLGHGGPLSAEHVDTFLRKQHRA